MAHEYLSEEVEQQSVTISHMKRIIGEITAVSGYASYQSRDGWYSVGQSDTHLKTHLNHTANRPQHHLRS